MCDETTGEKKVCIKRKIHNCIFSVIFENIYVVIKWTDLGFLRDIIEDNKNNDSWNILLEERKRKWQQRNIFINKNAEYAIMNLFLYTNFLFSSYFI